MNVILRGLVAGCIATLPMTVAMAAMKRRLPWWQRYALPPRQITRTAVRKLGIASRIDHNTMTMLTGLAHFGYGSAVGIPYTVFVERLPGPPPLKGALYGLGVWAASYLQLLPRLNLLYSATVHPRERTALMIAAHVIWGASLGLASHRLGTRSSDTFEGPPTRIEGNRFSTHEPYPFVHPAHFSRPFSSS